MKMNEIEERLFAGEDYVNQFKIDFHSIDALAAEIVAFANSDGGAIYVGVTDDGDVLGLDRIAVKRLNQWVSSAASQKITPPLSVKTENVVLDGRIILIIRVPLGDNKPYAANKGDFWVKVGADKRRAVREELVRLMQASGQFYADEMVSRIPLADFDTPLFRAAYQKYFGEFIDISEIAEDVLLQNLKLAEGDFLTLAGALLFGKTTATKLPQFAVQATSYRSIDQFVDKDDYRGTLLKQYEAVLSFLLRNLRRTADIDDFNAGGQLEVPIGALKEAVANALVHRDYLISAPISVGIYVDRVEIISPGKMPNTITIESASRGIHIERNPIIMSFLARESHFGYTGRGSGIPRILRLCKDAGVDVKLVESKEDQTFSVIFKRSL